MNFQRPWISVCNIRCVCVHSGGFCIHVDLRLCLCYHCVIAVCNNTVIDCWQTTPNWVQRSRGCPVGSTALPATHARALAHTPHICQGRVGSAPLEHGFAPADGKTTAVEPVVACISFNILANVQREARASRKTFGSQPSPLTIAAQRLM